ncbi:MAG: pilus assembly protein CpaC [Xanthobacteraceae bacterium]|nr:MAG: pilus assembly protein CpaC [Xanthobacteraceae bacterium]
MSVFESRRRARPLVVISVVALPLMAAEAFAADSVSVIVDQAKLMKLPEHVSTLVVGNPFIADVTLQPGGMVVVTGKGYGATNFVAMDRDGNILMDTQVQVEGPSEKLVTVYRGLARESYSCTPNCQRRITLGDGPEFFHSTIAQTDSLNTKVTVSAEKRLEKEGPR